MFGMLQIHMTSRGEWFRDMGKPDVSGYVQTGDDTAHPIAHVGDVPLNTKNGKSKYLADVLHVPRENVWAECLR